MNKTRKQIVVNIIWGGFATLLGYGINFFLIPIITEHLGIEAYGFIGLANTFISYIDLIAIALNAFAARHIALSYHNNNFKEANRFYNSVFISNIIFTLLAIIPCYIFIKKMECFMVIPQNLIRDVKILFAFVFFNYAINIVGTAFVAIVFLKNKTSITFKTRLLYTILYTCIVLYYLYSCELKVYHIAFANLLASCITVVINYICTRKIAPEIKLNVFDCSARNVKILLTSGIWNSINNVGNVLNNGLDLLITNMLLSPTVMGQISLSKQFSAVMTVFTSIIITAFQPKQLEAYANNNVQLLKQYLKVAMRLSGTIGNTFVILFFCFGEDFLKLWFGNQDVAYIFRLCLIILIGDVIVIAIRPLYYVFELTDKLKKVYWITIVEGLINVFFMLILIPRTCHGGYVVVGTTMILNILVGFMVVPKLASNFLNIPNVFLEVLIRHLLTCLVGVVVFGYICRNVVCNKWEQFFKYVIPCGILVLLFCLFSEIGLNNIKHKLGITDAE